MRFTLVSETYPPEVNGVALTVQGLERGLIARGHQVEVVRPRQDRHTPAPQDHQLVASAALPRYPGLRLGLPCTGRLHARWSLHRPDAIYVATEGPLGWSALRAAAELGIPVATGFHTRFDQYMRRYGAGFLGPVVFNWLRRFHNRGNATVVPTAELAGFLDRHGYRHVVTVGRAVDTGLFHPDRRDPRLRAAWGAGDNDLVVIHVGRIAAEKNLPLAVSSFREIQARRPGARMVWVGDGPARDTLARDNPDFIFTGVQRGEDVARHFASADLFVFPSTSETFGNVTLEAMASGVATVAYRYGAAGEHLRDGIDGRAVETGDSHAFSDAAVELASNDTLRRRLARNARERVSGLSPEAVTAEFEQLLSGLAWPGARAA